MKFDKSYFKELLNEAPLNLGKVHLPPQKTVMAINRKLKATAPEILKDYRRLLKDLQSSFAVGKEIVYIRDEPKESYRKKTGFGNAHRVVMRDRTKSPLGKEVVYHKGSMETTYDTVLAFTEEYIPEGVASRSRRAASKISTDTINQAADKNRKQKPIPTSVKKRVADDLARQKKFRQKNRQAEEIEEKKDDVQQYKLDRIKRTQRKWDKAAERTAKTKRSFGPEKKSKHSAMSTAFKKAKKEDVDIEEGGLDGRDVRGGKWVNDKYVMSKKDYSKARADVKSKIKGKPYIMTMDPKSGATILTPVVLEEVQGNRPAQAKDPYTVKYSYTKTGRIMHSVLANKKDAEKFLKNVKGLGMNGIIVKGEWYANKYTKEEVEDIDEIEFNRAYKGKKPDKAAVKADLTRRMIKMGKKTADKKKKKKDDVKEAIDIKKIGASLAKLVKGGVKLKDALCQIDTSKIMKGQKLDQQELMRAVLKAAQQKKEETIKKSPSMTTIEQAMRSEARSRTEVDRDRKRREAAARKRAAARKAAKRAAASGSQKKEDVIAKTQKTVDKISLSKVGKLAIVSPEAELRKKKKNQDDTRKKKRAELQKRMGNKKEEVVVDEKKMIKVKLNPKKKIGYTITSPGKMGKDGKRETGKVLKRQDVPGKKNIGETTMKKFSEYKEEQPIDEKAQWRSSFESKKELAKMAKGLVKEINAISIPDPSDSSFGGDSKKYAQAEHQMTVELAKVKMGIESATKHLGVIKAIGKFK